MNVNYIAELNAFNRWVEINHLSGSSQLLMFKLYALFNRCGWPEWIRLENRKLMSEADFGREATFIKHRDELVERGLIFYLRGGSGFPGKYKLCLFSEMKDEKGSTASYPIITEIGKAESPLETLFKNDPEIRTKGEVLYEAKARVQTESGPDVNTVVLNDSETAAGKDVEGVTQNAVQSAAQYEVQSADQSADLYKQNDIKHILPYGALADNLTKRVLEGVEKWIGYKREKRQNCTPRELYELFENARRNTEKYGEDAVLDVISQSVSSGYKGIIWDRLGRSAYRKHASLNYNYQQQKYTAEQLRHISVDLLGDGP